MEEFTQYDPIVVAAKFINEHKIYNELSERSKEVVMNLMLLDVEEQCFLKKSCQKYDELEEKLELLTNKFYLP